jgi:predicted transcriptional regulator
MGPRRKRQLPPLGHLEELALEHLWSAGESDVIGTHAAIGSRRGISVNTVGSTLERLHRKGLARRHKVSHAYRYSAAVERDSFRAQLLADAAGGVRELASQGLLAAFVDLLSDADVRALDELQQLIARKRGGSR